MKLRDFQILSLGYIVLTFLPVESGFSFCLFYNTTGVPCPGCGLTRAIHHIWQGNWLSAIQYHAVSFAVLFVLLFFVVTIVVKPAARLYDDHKKLFNTAISLGAFVIFMYGGLRVVAQSSADSESSRYFKTFHEPALIKAYVKEQVMEIKK